MQANKNKLVYFLVVVAVVCAIVPLFVTSGSFRCSLPDPIILPRPYSEETKSEVAASATPVTLIYHSQPSEFSRGLSSCMLDPSCHILYQHVQKTGGQGVENLFFSIFGHRYDACCGGDMLDRFRRNTKSFCLYPFSSYEVIRGFDEIVNTCNEKFYKQKDHRLVILTSIREPLDLTLSAIHQTCNKRWRKRDDRVKAACEACSFEQDEGYWMRHPGRTVDDYSMVLRQAIGTLKEFDHYWVDTVDLSTMFKDLQLGLHPLYEKQFTAYFKTKHNPEKLDRCEFSMHSKMINKLRPSSTFYRNFTRGLVGA
jgi:hypothetical protein